jgi:hypothetical protein
MWTLNTSWYIYCFSCPMAYWDSGIVMDLIVMPLALHLSYGVVPDIRSLLSAPWRRAAHGRPHQWAEPHPACQASSLWFLASETTCFTCWTFGFVLTPFSKAFCPWENNGIRCSRVVIGSRLGALQCCFCISYTCARESTNVLCLLFRSPIQG